MNSLVFLSNQRNNKSNSFKPGNMNKYLIVVYASILTIDFCNQPCFMPFNFSFGISLRLVHPFDTDRLMTFGNISKFLSVILYDGFDFFIICNSPILILCSFLEVNCLTIIKEAKESEIGKSLSYLVEILKTFCTFLGYFI